VEDSGKPFQTRAALQAEILAFPTSALASGALAVASIDNVIVYRGNRQTEARQARKARRIRD
jgi:hypothetical protein